jgi:hypothetical protein
MKWSKVLHVPFHGAGDEPRLLLLFYRSESIVDLDSSPLPLLSALLFWLFHVSPTGAPPCLDAPATDPYKKLDRSGAL